MAKKKEEITKEQQTVEPVFTVDEARLLLSILGAVESMLGDIRGELESRMSDEEG